MSTSVSKQVAGHGSGCAKLANGREAIGHCNLCNFDVAYLMEEL